MLKAVFKKVFSGSSSVIKLRLAIYTPRCAQNNCHIFPPDFRSSIFWIFYIQQRSNLIRDLNSSWPHGLMYVAKQQHLEESKLIFNDSKKLDNSAMASIRPSTAAWCTEMPCTQHSTCFHRSGERLTQSMTVDTSRCSSCREVCILLR